MLPKNEKALEKEYNRCKKTFISLSKESYKDYFEEAYSDLNSADKEDNDKWAIAKAYQALFMYCNGLLVRKAGFYSKDHGCVLVGLLKHNTVSKEILEKIRGMLEEKSKAFTEIELNDNFFEEVSKIRIARNKYLYLPKTQRKLKDLPKERIKEVREIMQILSEAE